MKKYLAINIAAIFALLVVAGSAFYHFVIYPPIYEEKRITNIDGCNNQYRENYTNMWERQCKNLSLEKGCELDYIHQRIINDLTDTALKACIARYPR